jgi:hypothetical protein
LDDINSRGFTQKKKREREEERKKRNTVLKPREVVLHHLFQTGDSFTLKNHSLGTILEHDDG